MGKKAEDLNQAEGTILGCGFDIFVGTSIILAGIYLNILGWVEGVGVGAKIAAVIVFLLCIGVGVMEIKGGVDGLKKLGKSDD